MRLEWKNTPERSSDKRPAAPTGNLWFGITMGLLGVIAGFILANVLQ